MLDPNIPRRNVASAAACGRGSTYAISGMAVRARIAGEGDAPRAEFVPA